VKIIKTFVHVVVICLFLSGAASADTTFRNMVVFGDSLSDTGNLASVIGPFPEPPYFMGSRVSNGPVAVEVLAGFLGLSAEPSLYLIGAAKGDNYAVAGASAAGEQLTDLSGQVGGFLLNNGGLAPADSLYVVVIGGNDIRLARDESDRRESAQIVNRAVAAVDQNIRALIASGARSFVVSNSGDIGSIPETKLLAELMSAPKISRKATRKSISFNRQLASKLKKIEREFSIDIVPFDLFRTAKFVQSNSDAFGFDNIVDACFSSVTFMFNPECEFGKYFDNYYFFDGIHPTAKAHTRIARALFAVIPQS
jgi:phospholipase/lecithinase/hemolysin